MGGFSATTANTILYGTDAYCTVNGTDLGALLGDISVEMATEEVYPEFLQSFGPVSGTGKIVAGTGKVTVTMSEWAYATLGSLFHLGYSTDANSAKIGSGALGTITELTNVIITGTQLNSGKDFKVTIPKSRVTSPVATTLSKSEIAGLEVSFEALYQAAGVNVFPMYIEIEK